MSFLFLPKFSRRFEATAEAAIDRGDPILERMIACRPNAPHRSAVGVRGLQNWPQRALGGKPRSRKQPSAPLDLLSFSLNTRIAAAAGAVAPCIWIRVTSKSLKGTPSTGLGPIPTRVDLCIVRIGVDSNTRRPSVCV